MRGDEPEPRLHFTDEERKPYIRGEIPKEVARKMKNLQELPKLKDSMSYLYVEHAIIEQNDAAIIAIQKNGRTPIPIAAMTCLLLASENP